MSSEKSLTRGVVAGALSVALIALGVVVWLKTRPANQVGGAVAAAALPATTPPAPAAEPPGPPANKAVEAKPAVSEPTPATPETKVSAPTPREPTPAKADVPAREPAHLGGLDHPMFGGTPSRNMVNLVAKGITDKPEPDGPGQIWKAELGSRAYGGPTIAGGRVFVGTNNERPRNPRDQRKTPEGDIEPIDKGILMVFDEKTGSFLWQAVHDKLGSGQVNDWPKEGLCSTPTVIGDRVYYVSNRCTIVCADVHGLGDGNQGATGEKYKEKTDADIVWEFDMIGKEGVFPHNMSAGSPLVVGDLLYTVTANGVDEGHINIPSPGAPSFVALDRNTGKPVWTSSIPGKNIMHGQWSNPCYGEVNGTKQVIFPGGDGFLYGFDAAKGTVLWKCDCNPKAAVYKLGGEGTRSDFIGTPVFYKGKVYIGLGQDPEHFTGVSHFWCIDPAKATKPGDDISPEVGEWGKPGKPNPNSGVVWHFGGPDPRPNVPRDFLFGRTMSTACIVDDVLYISELQGLLHCLDANTGKKFWSYDTKGAIWGSPFYTDGKVYLANEGGDLFVFKHGKAPQVIDDLDNPGAKDQKAFRKAMLDKRKEIEKEYLIHKQEFDAPIRSTPVVANGILFVMTEKTLYAFGTK